MGSGISKKQSETPVEKKKKGKKTFQLKCLTEHTDGINAMCLSPDGNTLITVSEDKTGRLWDTKTDECVGLLQGHVMYIKDVCVSERYIFTCSADKTVRKWNLESGVLIKVFTGHQSTVNQVICSGDLVFSCYVRPCIILYISSFNAVLFYSMCKFGSFSAGTFLVCLGSLSCYLVVSYSLLYHILCKLCCYESCSIVGCYALV